MDRKQIGVVVIVCIFLATLFIDGFAATGFLIISAVIMGNMYLDSKVSQKRTQQEEHIRTLEYQKRLVMEAREQAK